MLRIAAGIMGLMMLIVVVFSATFIAAEADHDCCGEDCPVCVCIQLCESALQNVGGGIAIQPHIIIPFLFVMLTAALFVIAVSTNTPVSRKVRLNN